METSCITPTVGRIVHYMLETNHGLQVRPAIVVRVGPSSVGEKDTGQVALRVFTDMQDQKGEEPLFREANEASPDEFAAGTWRWPPR